MEEKKSYKIYKIIMLMVLVAFITFLVTTIGMNEYFNNKNNNGSTDAIVSEINNSRRIIHKYYLKNMNL